MLHSGLQVIFLFVFLECNRSHVQTIASHILIVISRVQSFALTNDCKSYFYLYFWSAIICMYKQLQIIFFIHFWSAIICMYKWLQAICWLWFLECNRLHVRTIASHIFISGSVPVCMCECWLIERSEGMDRWSWSDAPHKNRLVMHFASRTALTLVLSSWTHSSLSLMSHLC